MFVLVVSNNDDAGELIVKSLTIAQEVYDCLRDGSITKQQAIEKVNEAFPQFPHWPTDKEWTDKHLSSFVDEIINGSVTEEIAIYNLNRCIY